MQSEELKPCPFCGGQAERVDIEDGDNSGGSFVHCTVCDASGNIEFEFKENFISNWNRRASREAALSAAEPVEQDENPMRFFADNVDRWGALEWFNRLVDACEDHDRKRTKAFRCEDPDEKDMLSLSADTSKMIMSSSAFRLAREHKDEIRSALSAQVQDVATHRHKKRRSEYALIGVGKMQAENWRELIGEQYLIEGEEVGTAVDMREVAIYRSIEDGTLWVRPVEEFNDGRFEALPATPSKQEG